MITKKMRQSRYTNGKIRTAKAAHYGKAFITDPKKLKLFLRMFMDISDKCGGVDKTINEMKLGHGVYSDLIRMSRLSTDMGYRILNKYKSIKNQQG